MAAIDYKSVFEALLARLQAQGEQLAEKYRKKLAAYAKGTRDVLADLEAGEISEAEAELAAEQLFNAAASTLLSGAYSAKRSFVASLLAAAQTALTVLIKLLAAA